MKRAAGFIIRVKNRKDRDTWWGNEAEELAEKKIVVAGDWDKSPDRIVQDLKRILDRYS